jgi:nucleoside-diphosphate-sugar epimerase
VRVFVTGATGVLGSAAVRALLEDGHEVAGIARDEQKAARLASVGATPVRELSLLDEAALTSALGGFDAVCNLVTSIPVGFAAILPRAWRTNDRLRTEGSSTVARAARDAGVRTLVQESVSFMYADGADSWITEESTVAVTRATDPAAVAEDNASRFGSASRTAVILRFGLLVGKDPITRWRLNQAQAGRPIILGDPAGWAHLVHPHDAGAAVAAALASPGGVYNVGADPVRRSDMNLVFARAVGRDSLRHVSPLLVRLGGERIAPMTRSHRVSSAKLHEMTGWKPVHHKFDSSWWTSPTTV